MTDKRPRRIQFETSGGQCEVAFVDYGHDADELLMRVMRALRADIEAQARKLHH